MIKLRVYCLVIIHIITRILVSAWIPTQIEYGEEVSMQDWKSGSIICWLACISQKSHRLTLPNQALIKVLSLVKQFLSTKLSKYCHMGYRIVIVQYNICMYSYGEPILVAWP